MKKTFEFIQILKPMQESKVLTINKSGLEEDSKVTEVTKKDENGKMTEFSTIVLSDRPTLIAYPTLVGLRHFNYVHNGYKDDDNRANEAQNTWEEEMMRANVKFGRDFNMVRILLNKNEQAIKRMEEETKERKKEIIRIINKLYSVGESKEWAEEYKKMLIRARIIHQKFEHKDERSAGKKQIKKREKIVDEYIQINEKKANDEETAKKRSIRVIE